MAIENPGGCPDCGYVSVLVDQVLTTRVVPCAAHAAGPRPIELEPAAPDPLPRRRLISRLSLA